MLKDKIAVILYGLVQNEIDEKLISFDDCKMSFYSWVSFIIDAIANDIERINISIPTYPDTKHLSHLDYMQYARGAKDEHAYIVEYLRGLLDT